MPTSKRLTGNTTKMGNFSEESCVTELDKAVNTYLLVPVE